MNRAVITSTAVWVFFGVWAGLLVGLAGRPGGDPALARIEAAQRRHAATPAAVRRRTSPRCSANGNPSSSAYCSACGSTVGAVSVLAEVDAVDPYEVCAAAGEALSHAKTEVGWHYYLPNRRTETARRYRIDPKC